MTDTSQAAEKKNLPAAPGVDPQPVVIGSRHGMFGASDAGDTSGFGGLVAPVLFPAAAVRPYGGYFDEVTDPWSAPLSAAARHTLRPSSAW